MAAIETFYEFYAYASNRLPADRFLFYVFLSFSVFVPCNRLNADIYIYICYGALLRMNTPYEYTEYTRRKTTFVPPSNTFSSAAS